MKGFALISAIAAVGSVTATPTKSLNEPPSKRASLPQVSTSGNAFWADGKRFYIRGIDYKPGGNAKDDDPLADKTVCDRDIKHFKELGVNTIRIYAVDNSKDHDHCMQALADAGIYVVADLNTIPYSLNREKPFQSYNTDYLESIFATVEMMSKYDNTLAFFSGNEVINDKTNVQSAPFIKAVTRDVKQYIKSRKLRKVPIGYSAADVAENRMQTAMYMNCGSDDVRSDFFAFNDYSWCNSNFKTAGWDEKVKNFTDYGLPIFLSEYGCIKNGKRKFEELSELMSKDMTGVYSGGLMFEYSEEGDNYGIVDVSGDGDVSEKNPEYDNFKKALSKYSQPSGDGGASKSTHSSKCPSGKDDPNWDVNPDELPAMPEKAKKFMTSGVTSGPGIKKPGSQDAVSSGLSAKNVSMGTSSGGSGSGDGDDDSDSAAGAIKSPAAVTGFAVFLALCGTMLL